jgi:hypothetical protein
MLKTSYFACKSARRALNVRGINVQVKEFFRMAKSKPKPKTVIKPTFSVRLDKPERDALAKAAKAQDRPQAYVLRQFLCEALKAKGFLK